MISLDCETTGLDLRHGVKPFMVQVCWDSGEQAWWEWDVDPETREPVTKAQDLYEITEVIKDANREDGIVLQNPKFDVAALRTILGPSLKWDWSKTYDTLLAGHLLGSNESHDLTSMALLYLGINIQPLEDAIKQATKEARRLCQSKTTKYPGWRIAKAGLSEMPSAKATVWKNDMWLPRAIMFQELADFEESLERVDRIPPSHSNKDTKKTLRLIRESQELLKEHPWWTVCSDYGNGDSEVTLALFKRQKELLEERGLWRIYKERLKILPIVYGMEYYGITGNKVRLREKRTEYLAESQRAGRVCVNIAKSYNYDLQLPKGSNNNSLKNFIFGEEGLHLEPVSKSKKTGAPSLDKACMEEYLSSLPNRSKALKFIQNLAAKRKRDTALSYMESYEKFWLPLGENNESFLCCVKKQKRPSRTYKSQRKAGLSKGNQTSVKERGYLSRTSLVENANEQTSVLKRSPKSVQKNDYGRVSIDWFVLHPSLNPTGTHTLRWSSQNPNEQNISKQEGFNLRYCFGPASGREWWSLDAKNLELRIPAYEANETEQIALFEKPDEPPFFGSNHLLVCSILHPEKFAGCVRDGVSFKDRYKTLYGYTKNGNFAVQYGAVEQSGTADRAYHVVGAQRKVQGRFREVKKLNERMIAFANEHGYVETMPDKTVDPKRGYPLLCTRSYYGKISPTIPLNYHVQGTACWWMMKAMIRVQEYLDVLNAKPKSQGYYTILQVHDELVFDFPKGRNMKHPKSRGVLSGKRFFQNLRIIRKIQKLMEQGGDDIGVPTPVSISYHGENWSEGVSI